MKEIEASAPAPEQLVKLLDLQLAQQRERGKRPERNRAIFLVSAMLAILVGAAAALMVLRQMLVESANEGRRAPQAVVAPQ